MLVVAPACAVAQVEAHCVEAHRFVSEVRGMAAVTEPDTIDDWRTDRTVHGCRVTAAGVTTQEHRAEAIAFFQALRDDGWTRTPDPQDAPNEASLRFRKEGTDCLFSFYTAGLLGTEAEAIVVDARVPGAGERRYNFAVQCMPAAPATPSGSAAAPTERGPPQGKSHVYRRGNHASPMRSPAVPMERGPFPTGSGTPSTGVGSAP